MALPIRNLPVIQNWDCHVCGSCCQEYVVALTDEERKRIEAQGWDNDPEIGSLPLFKRSGPWWARHYNLNQRGDGSCVFLSKEGRCRIHEKFGYEVKPLGCRLFPFVLVPAGDHWRVGMRFACPSAAWNKGRNLSGHEATLRQFAMEMAQRAGLDKQPPGMALAPRLQSGQRMEWPDLLRIVNALLTLLHNRDDRMELRLRKCLALAKLCREARFHKGKPEQHIQGKRLAEFLQLVASSLDGEVPRDPASVQKPNWVGRILFRQAIALFTRKDHGPDRGMARQGRIALMRAAWRFARGKGVVPRLHNKISQTSFEQIEANVQALSPEAEEVLERYYTIKVESLQFFGATNFNMPFWEGLEMLALTFPVILWVARALADLPRAEAVMQALTIVDDHFGYNPVLGSRRQRFSFRLLANAGQLDRLIAWYARWERPK